MPRKHADLKAVHDAADFYEPRMAVAFMRGMQRLQRKINTERLADQIAHRSRIMLPVDARKSMDDVKAVARNSFIRGIGLGEKQLEP